ncbi:hypothetical protein ACVINW_005507 [Bradyrhizobium sp. USDA 4461]
MDLLDPSGFDRRNHRGMRIEREVGADLALEAELLAIGRQQQFDRGGVEADAVIEPAHAVGRVDALDGEHRGQDLGLGDRRRIAREQGLDIERPAGFDHEMHEVAGDIDPRHLVDDLGDLGHDEAVLVAGRLDHRRCVFGVRPGIEVAVLVGADGCDQRDVRRQIDEVAREQLEIGMDGAELDLAAEQHPRHARRLRARIGEVEPPRDALLEDVEVGRQHHARLHHVEIADLGRVQVCERRGEDVGLLLVVTLEAHPIT